MSFFKKILKVALPVAASALIPGIGGSIAGGLGSLLGSGGSFLGSLTGGGSFSSLLSGGLNLFGGIMSNNANAALAQRQMAFQADQTGTAYQRAVADLKAAGLNPMLAYTNGGAASGSGATATMQNAIGSGVSTAMAAKMNDAQIENMKAQNMAINAQTVQSLTQSDLNKASTVKATADAALSAANANLAKANIPRVQSEFDRNSGDPRTIFGQFLNSIKNASSAVPVSKSYNQSRPYGFK